MPDEEDIPTHSFEIKLIIQLTEYTSKAASSRKSKKKTESKAKKTKEATFTLSSDNHLEFLRCLLIKHGENTTYCIRSQDRRDSASGTSIQCRKHMQQLAGFDDHRLPFLSSE
jgi:hypothetical protein